MTSKNRKRVEARKVRGQLIPPNRASRNKKKYYRPAERRVSNGT